jgi:colicin import membrane protein
MLRRPYRPILTAALASAFLFAGAPSGLRAQNLDLPPVEDFVVVEDEEAHRLAAEEARKLERECADALPRLKDLESIGKTRFEARKAHIESLKKQIDVAGREKREADKKALEEERKKSELAIRVSERLIDLVKTETEWRRSLEASARMEAQWHEKALALAAARRRAAEVVAVTSASDIARRSEELRSAEKQALEAYKTWSERAQDATSKQKNVAEKRLATWEAWRQSAGH